MVFCNCFKKEFKSVEEMEEYRKLHQVEFDSYRLAKLDAEFTAADGDDDLQAQITENTEKIIAGEL